MFLNKQWLVGQMNVLRIFLAVLNVGVYGQRPPGQRVETGTQFNFPVPKTTEEENFSNFVPDNLMCDACHAVSYQLYTTFDTFNAKRKSFEFRLPESELIDLVEKACDYNKYKEYGIKQVGEVKRLSGPGLITHDTMAILSSGGLWPTRLSDLCGSFLEGLGEEGLYSLYLRGIVSVKHMRTLMCYGEGFLGHCTKVINLRKKQAAARRGEL